MRCSECGTQNPVAKKFCSQCGSALPLLCPKCGIENPGTSRFCGDCGTSLTANLPNPVQSSARTAPVSGTPQQTEFPSATDGERKTITALFADIKGSMELIENLDPEQARNIIDPALRLMMEAIRRYGGRVVQSTGDGIFAIFGAPFAHEDHAQRALYAALRMQDDLNRYCDRLGAEGRERVQARVGINTGEAVVRSLLTGAGHPEYTPIGHSIGLAARMEALAPIGSVAVTAQTKKLCDGYFNFKPLGAARVRGVSEPVGVYEATGLGPLRTHFQLSAERGLSKFVGRQSELEQLKLALDLAKAGRGQLVAVLGEAGVGKSRLFHEFKALAQSECMVLETFSLAYGKDSSYLPVIELLKHYFTIAAEDDKRRRREQRVAKLLAVESGRVFSPWRRRAREKVTSKVMALDRRLEDILPYLFGLLGIQDSADPLVQMDPQIKRRRTLDAIKRVLLRESLNQPLMVVFEDLHWIDDETQAFLNLLADSIANAPLLLLVNYRPEYYHEWNNKSYYTQLRLEPLRPENAEQMLGMLFGNDREFIPLRRLIIEKTEGNPFFIEELVQALLEQGILQRTAAEAKTTLSLAKSLDELKLPPTVQAVLASRIDRLAPSEKELLQTLAVIGREFSIPLIKRVVVDCSEIELERMIATLQGSEFIYERPAFPAVEHVFKHALTQEVAYNSLLLERRKTLHERIAQALEALFVDSIDDHLVDLSYHYSRSGNDSRAIDYLVRAGEQAQQRSAYAQAAAYLEQALTRLNDQPAGPERYRKEFAVRAGLADSAIVISGYAAPEYEHHLTRRHELAQRLGDTTQIFYSLVGMSVLSAFRLELNKAQDIAWKLLGIADHEHDPDMQLQAHGCLANVLWQLGDINASREHAEKGLKLFAPERHLPYGDEHWRAACQFYACTCTTVLGFPDKGLRQALEFLAWARERAQLISLVFALNSVATILAWRGEEAQALKYADDLLALAAEHGFGNWHSFGQLLRGQALALSGKADEAIAEMKSGLDSLAATGAAVPGWAYANLALAFLAAQQPEEGLGVAAKGLELGVSTGDAEAKSELHRLRGELLLMSDPTKPAAAEASFHEAIEAARKQHAKFPELRATNSLARLLAKQDRRGEARAMLAEIYGWFNEGFDTADLRNVKALLDELSG
ncbi:MAG: AAA family ATPase [Deltaproteobacteria bacterium]|nr:AAA family ATPase [Deltaproteobacteria bacterium]